VLSRKGIPPAATVVISGYERVVALSVSLLLAACGALYLFGTLSLNLETGGLSLIKLVLGLIAVTVAGALFAWGQAVLALMRKVTRELLFGILRSFVISLAIQGTTLAAYVALERALAPHIGLASLAAASCIVMLAASLPVSFGGWGLRELSAVVALQAIGLSSASALVIALLIGVLSLVVIAGMALVVMLGWEPKPDTRAPMIKAAEPDYALAIDWVLPLMAATAVLFQIYLPTNGGLISVNLADPVVLLGAGLFALHHFRKGWPAWCIPQFGIWVAAASAVILFSLLRGIALFGWTDWAVFNKGLGWLILLCYGATGALIVRRAQLRGFDYLLKTFAASGAVIALIDVCLTFAKWFGATEAGALVEARVSGLAQNPNAFAFLLVLGLAAAIVMRTRLSAQTALMTAMLLGIWFTGSRAALLAVPVVFAVAIAAGGARRPIWIAIFSAVSIVVATWALAQLSVVGLPGSTSMPGNAAGIGMAMSDRIAPAFNPSDAVVAQHLQTVIDGLAMFRAHPIFGAGLGAYMEEQLRATGVPLVIHSTPIWLLAETGILGFAVFLGAALRIFFNAIRRRGEPAALLMILILTAMAVMSSAHDMLYARAFWLLLGTALAMPIAAARGQETVNRSL
jgi:hypothetical protein